MRGSFHRGRVRTGPNTGCEPLRTGQTVSLGWAKPIIGRGPRPAFEMEQVLPGLDPDEPEPGRSRSSSTSSRSPRRGAGSRVRFRRDSRPASTCCKAFLNDPEVLFVDEPTASLDPDIADKVRTTLVRLQRERGLTMIYTSHNMLRWSASAIA